MIEHDTGETWFVGLTTVLALAVLTTGGGCATDLGGGGDASPGAPGGGSGVAAPASAVIGPEGGMVGAGNATLTIPAGALTQATTVTITAQAPVEGSLGSVYDITPDGQQLQVPATLTVDYAAGDLPAGFGPGDAAIVSLDEHYSPPDTNHPAAPVMAAIPLHLDTTTDATNTTASAPIRHFSRYGARPITRIPARPGAGFMLISSVGGPTGPGVMDVGAVETGISTNDGAGTTEVVYDLSAREILMLVATSPTSTAGDLYAHGLLVKLFYVTPEAQGVNEVQCSINTGVRDVGGEYTGNCVWGQRRLRLMDMGTPKTFAGQVAVELDVQGIEWQVYPPALGLPSTPHQPTTTDSAGDDVYLNGTLRVEHYYAIVLDLMAIVATNTGGQPQACSGSSQAWASGQFRFVNAVLKLQ